MLLQGSIFPFDRNYFTLLLTYDGDSSALALDILECLIEARYSKNKTHLLRQINLLLEKLRVLLRIAHHEKYLATNAYEYASREIQRAGQMTGGWLRHVSGQVS